MAAVSATITARVERLPVTRLHKRILIIVGMGLFFEMFDVFLAGVLGSVLVQEFSMSSTAVPLLLGSSFLGMFLGALFLNSLADRIGRRRAFLLELIDYSLFTLLGAFSPTAPFLIVCRFLAGLGIGALPALSDTYLSELLPHQRRGQLMAWAYTIQFLSVPAEGFLAMALVPTHFLWDGWRWLFVIGSLAGILIWFLQHALPESPRWLEATGRLAEAEQVVARFEQEVSDLQRFPVSTAAVPEPKPVPLSTILHPPFVRRTIMLVIFQIFQAVGYYAFGTLATLVLAAKGITITRSLGYLALSFIGYPVGSLLSIPVVERVQRKWLIVVSAFLMTVLGILFGSATMPALIVVSGFLYTLVSNVFSNAYHIFQAEVFPTAVRATAVGATYSISRLMSGLMPFVLLPVLKSYGATAMFAVVGAGMVIIMVDIGVLGPNTSGRSLEQVNEAMIKG